MSGDGFEGHGDFTSDDPWERFIAHQAAKGRAIPAPLEAYEATRSDLCDCGHWSRHHNVGKHGGCGHCECRCFNPSEAS